MKDTEIHEGVEKIYKKFSKGLSKMKDEEIYRVVSNERCRDT